MQTNLSVQNSRGYPTPSMPAPKGATNIPTMLNKLFDFAVAGNNITYEEKIPAGLLGYYEAEIFCNSHTSKSTMGTIAKLINDNLRHTFNVVTREYFEIHNREHLKEGSAANLKVATEKNIISDADIVIRMDSEPHTPHIRHVNQIIFRTKPVLEAFQRTLQYKLYGDNRINEELQEARISAIHQGEVAGSCPPSHQVMPGLAGPAPIAANALPVGAHQQFSMASTQVLPARISRKMDITPEEILMSNVIPELKDLPEWEFKATPYSQCVNIYLWDESAEQVEALAKQIRLRLFPGNDPNKEQCVRATTSTLLFGRPYITLWDVAYRTLDQQMPELSKRT